MTMEQCAIVFCFVLVVISAVGQTVEFLPFKPDIYPSDSRVFSLEDIGELSSSSSPPFKFGSVLICRTNKSPCCLTQPHRFGEWTHNNVNIGSRGEMEDYFRTWDDNQQIHLSLRAMHSGDPPTGEFCCQLPDSNDATQTQCVEIVSTSLSVSISPSGQNLVGQTYSLTCTASMSGGGSASRIVWLRGTDKVREMHNETTLKLTFQSLNSSDGGTYTCRVEVDTLVKISTTELVVLTSNPISSVAVTPPGPTKRAGADSLTLSCSAIITSGTPSFNWTGPESQGPTPVTAVQGSITFTDSFVLGRVKESYRGTFTCQVAVATFTAEASVTVAVQVPPVTVSITAMDTAAALHSYSLTCSVSAPATLDLTSHSYQWMRDGRMIAGETDQTLTFSKLPIMDLQLYTCQYTATSPYLVSIVNETSPVQIINIIVVIPSAPTNLMGSLEAKSILVTWSQSPLDVVDSYTISYSRVTGCVSDQPRSEEVTVVGSRREYYILSYWEEAAMYEINVTAENTAGSSPTSHYTRFTPTALPSCCVPSPISPSVSLTSITITWEREACLLRNGQSRRYSVRYREAGSSTIIATATVSIFDRTYTASALSPRTSYTFEVALVNEVGMGSYTATNFSTSTPSYVGLLLDDVLYPNNSVVTLADIGEGGATLSCLTDNISCCRESDGVAGAHGDWALPGGDPVVNMSVAVGDKFYRTRGASAVLLNHVSAASGPTGVFTCSIPDSQDNLQQVFVGIYPPEAGSPLITSLTYNLKLGILTCASTGGPASNVTWSRSGYSYQQSQRVMDTSTATYHNLLSIESAQLSTYTGFFKCSVSNSRGQTSTTTMTYKSIGLSGHRSLYPLGSSASVTCFSNLTVQAIQWVNASNMEVLLYGSRQQQLVLNVENITGDINNTHYLCDVSILLPGGSAAYDSQSFILKSHESMVRSTTSIMVIDTTSSGVTVQWMFVGPFDSMQKETCLVMYGTTSGPLDSSSSEMTADGGHQTYSILLHSLSPATEYNYVIQCRNDFDRIGITSAEMSFRTSDNESGAVKGLAITSLDDYTLVIFWVPPDMPNGIITSFLVRINDIRNARTLIEYATSDGDVTSHTVSGLVAGVPYNVSVAAVNEAGPGRLSSRVVFTRELEPSISPKHVVLKRISGSSISVTWTRLTLSEARGFIIYYTVAYFPLSSGSKRQEPNIMYRTIRKEFSQTTIQGLDKNTAYGVQVAASTAAGTGRYITLASIPIPEGDSGTIIGAVVVAVVVVVVIIVIIILVIVFAVKTKRSRSLSVKRDAPTGKIDAYGDIELKECRLDYKMPIPNGVEEIDSKNCRFDYEIPVPGRVEEIELKESPTYFEIPALSALPNHSEYINVNPSPAFGSLGFKRQGKNNLEESTSDGGYVVMH